VRRLGFWNSIASVRPAERRVGVHPLGPELGLQLRSAREQRQDIVRDRSAAEM
jgi:hypothetical protein